MVILAPVVLFAGAGNPPCTTGGGSTPPTPVGPDGPGQFAAPLQLQPGRSYRVGATAYDGTYGADPTQSYLPDYPDSFAELSLLDENPYPNFTFNDADALGNLPFGTAIRVSNNGRSEVLIKRDVGYGQGPGQAIPYRLDIYRPAAQALGVTKNPVDIQLAPTPGTAGTLGQLPPLTVTSTTTSACTTTPGTPAPLPITPGPTAQILSDGEAAAPEDAPPAVKDAIAAGNQIHTLPYPSPDVHYGPLANLWPAYDCSGAVSYLLYATGALTTAEDSSELEHYGAPGPGRWITVYATAGHAWIVVAGIAFDTSPEGQTVAGIPAGTGPRWRPDPTANLADGSPYVQRHPTGL